MKLKELLTEIFEENSNQDNQFGFGFNALTLYSRDGIGGGLSQYKERILQCEEFPECTELNFMNIPMILSNDNEPITAMDFKLVKGQKFKGVCYLLSLGFTPEVFNPDTIHTPVKDGACITPIVYNPETFKPLRKIVLEYNPESSQDGIIEGYNDHKTGLKNLLDKVLNNPYDYQIKGERDIIVRGVFEKNEVIKEVTPARYLTGARSFIKEEETPGVAYYLVKLKNDEGNEVAITVKTMLIPPHLKQLFKDTYGDRNLELTKEEIDKFLEENS